MLFADYATRYCISRVSEKNPRDRSHSLRMADLESPFGTEMRLVSPLGPESHQHHIPPREAPAAAAPAASRCGSCLQGAVLFFSRFKSLIQTAAGCPAAPGCCGGCEWTDEGDGWMGGRAAASQPQQVYISIRRQTM